jgi:hypothetical protein
MIISNEQLKKIYRGAYFFAETEDGYLQSFSIVRHRWIILRGHLISGMTMHGKLGKNA